MLALYRFGGWCNLTIARDNQELIVLANFVNLNIGKRGDYLLLRRKLRALLEFEVSNGARESEVAVYPAKIYKAPCSLDTCFLGCKQVKEGSRQ
jgi:hypothetical protein